MGFYVELFCETNDCPQQAEGPNGRTARSVGAAAKKLSWRRTANGWFCAACVAEGLHLKAPSP